MCRGRAAMIRPMSVELQDSARKLPANWNIATGIFLRRYVYERLPGKGGKPTFGTLIRTQLICGLWHGIFAGYFLFFLSTALFFEFAKVLYQWERGFLPAALQRSWPLWVVKVAITQVSLNYLATAFQLLNLRSCLHCWSQVYFMPHVAMLVVLVAGQVVRAPRSSVVGDTGSAADHNKGKLS